MYDKMNLINQSFLKQTLLQKKFLKQTKGRKYLIIQQHLTSTHFPVPSTLKSNTKNRRALPRVKP
uniref:Uncharacterized protein n=1 Tax=Arundo donax TaxID=35708 RepID=A0A0A9BGC1_ARUDO